MVPGNGNYLPNHHAQLYEGLTQWAYDLAAKFDARNQNSFFTDTTRTRLERETFKNLGAPTTVSPPWA